MRTYVNPVFDHVAPDPSIARDPDGVFWCYTTMAFYRRKRACCCSIRSRGTTAGRVSGIPRRNRVPRR
ncbi:MAG: hypothetical protein ACXVQU_00530 [Actinomycetota bacterium]